MDLARNLSGSALARKTSAATPSREKPQRQRPPGKTSAATSSREKPQRQRPQWRETPTATPSLENLCGKHPPLSGSALTGKPQRQRLHWKTSAATPSLEQNLAERSRKITNALELSTRVQALAITHWPLVIRNTPSRRKTGFAAENWLRGGN